MKEKLSGDLFRAAAKDGNNNSNEGDKYKNPDLDDQQLAQIDAPPEKDTNASIYKTHPEARSASNRALDDIRKKVAERQQKKFDFEKEE